MLNSDIRVWECLFEPSFSTYAYKRYSDIVHSTTARTCVRLHADKLLLRDMIPHEDEEE
jgi:hypothetical protein